MPYTPPSHLSPVTPTAPSSTHPHHQLDTHDYGHRRHPARSSSGSQNSLPRSRSSSTASRKRQHDDSVNDTNTDSSNKEERKQEGRLHIDTSLRQSPPPVTDSAMPAGAIISPPDSGHVSSDEEPAKAKQKAEKEIQELEKAVRESLQINRKGSPDLDRQFQFPAKPAGEELSEEETAELKKAARKIAHSRSTTDTAIVFTPPHQPTDSPANASVSDGDEEEFSKPPLIRKKSGELVKPAMRPKNRRTFSSMPGTPTYGKKGVHFNDDIQQVKHFLQVDRPIAVSAGGSPAEGYEDDREFPFGKQPPSPTLSGVDIGLCNFPRDNLERQSQPARLDKITLSADGKSLLGQIVVANLSFHKTVVARFTTDFWKTTSEVLGEYCADPLLRPKDGFDLFTFAIKLSDVTNIQDKTMLICVRYRVNGQEYWDNNSSMNFQVDFTKRQSGPTSAPSLGVRPIPRSRKNSAAPAQMRHKPSLDEDFSRGFDSGVPLKLKQPARIPDATQPQKANRSSQQFSNRYDFGASLTAALNHAQSNLGDQSGVRRSPQQGSPSDKASEEPPKSSITQRYTPPPSGKHETPQTDAIHTNKSALDSRAYQEFVNKFCFFGSGKPQTNGASQDASPNQAPKKPQPTMGTDGARDDKPPIPGRAAEHTVPHVGSQQSMAACSYEHSNSALSPRLMPRTGSPTYGSPHGCGSRSSSPASLGYRFAQNSDYGLMPSGTATPAMAIHG